MYISFHYHTIKTLAFHAGFSIEDAEIIAGASQFVDDSIVHKPVKLFANKDLLVLNNKKRIVDVNYTPVTEQSFITVDPICTAYKGLSRVWAFKPSAQKKLYVSFHFIPPDVPKKDKDFSFVVKANGKLAQKLVETALLKLSYSRNKFERVEALVQLGVALHSYADTWAHSGFSGLHDPRVNDISNVECFENGKWERVSHFTRLGMNLMPDIGHAEAGEFPDCPYMKWRYERAVGGKQYVRDNKVLYMAASKAIFEYLKDTAKSSRSFSSINAKLEDCFNQKLDGGDGFVVGNVNGLSKASAYYGEMFDLPFDYDAEKWKVKDTEFSGDENEVLWAYFHKAAYFQRSYINNHIKKEYSSYRLWMRYLKAVFAKKR